MSGAKPTTRWSAVLRLLARRWVRAVVRGDNRQPTVRQEDDAGAAPAGQRGAARGDWQDPRVDGKVLYAGGVGEQAAQLRWAGGFGMVSV